MEIIDIFEACASIEHYKSIKVWKLSYTILMTPLEALKEEFDQYNVHVHSEICFNYYTWWIYIIILWLVWL